MKLLLALVISLPFCVRAQCTYAVAPTTVNVGPGSVMSSGATNITVTAPDNCAWTATVPANSPWVHISLVLGGPGNGTVIWSADPNPNPVARGGSIVIGGQTVTIAQAAADCNYGLAPSTLSVPGTGGPGTATVTTRCTWAVGTTATWITVPKGESGSGNGPVTYTVAANQCVTPRNGSLVVGYPGTSNPQFLAMLSITQDGGINALTFSPSSLSLSNGSANGSIAITTPVGCTWAASSDVSWIQLATPLSGNGPGQVSYHILANTNVARSGNIHIGPLVVPVMQEGVATPSIQVNAVTNGATNRSDAVSPGEIVVLYGVNLGPSILAKLQLAPDGQSVTKSISGAQVLFDGTPGAMIYTSANQISAVVPYSVAGKTTTQVQVTYNNATSAAVPVPVQAATPGIFTQDSSGLGPGAILNQDYKLNTTSNRAGRGEAIMIYCTGGGATNPAAADGAVTAAPYPQLTQPVTVTIGGVNAPVLYQGAAPGAIAGLTQINAQVPSTLTPGSSLPIVVKIGNWTSQSNVTVAVQ